MRGTLTRSKGRVAIAATVLAFALGATACGGDQTAEGGAPLEEQDALGEDEEVDEVSAEGEPTIFEEPDQFIDKDVTVTGEVVEVVNPDDSFLIAAPNTAEPTILVIGSGETAVSEGDVVEVEGQARLFDITAVEADFGFDLPDEAFEDHDGDPFIRANKVTVES